MIPRLALMTALYGASWSYTVGSAGLSFLFGVQLAPRTAQNVTTDPRLQPPPLAPDPLGRHPGRSGWTGCWSGAVKVGTGWSARSARFSPRSRRSICWGGRHLEPTTNGLPKRPVPLRSLSRPVQNHTAHRSGWWRQSGDKRASSETQVSALSQDQALPTL